MLAELANTIRSPGWVGHAQSTLDIVQNRFRFEASRRTVEFAPTVKRGVLSTRLIAGLSALVHASAMLGCGPNDSSSGDGATPDVIGTRCDPADKIVDAHAGDAGMQALLIRPEPTIVLFSPSANCTTLRPRVALMNSSQSVLEIRGLAIAPSGFSIEPIKVPVRLRPKDSLYLVLGYKSGRPSETWGELEVSTDQGCVQLPILGQTVDGDLLSTNTAVIDFGAVTKGQPSKVETLDILFQSSASGTAPSIGGFVVVPPESFELLSSPQGWSHPDDCEKLSVQVRMRPNTEIGVVTGNLIWEVESTTMGSSFSAISGIDLVGLVVDK